MAGEFNAPAPGADGAELFGLAGPLGVQTGGTGGVVPSGKTVGMVPRGELAGMARIGSPVAGGVGTTYSGGGPAALASDGSLTPAG